MQFRPNRFEVLPIVVKNLLIINALVFLAQWILADKLPFSINDTFALHTWQSQLFKPWQLVTHIFMHGDFWHLVLNMLPLWMLGSTLEALWGPKKFFAFYIVCGLGAAFCHLGVLYFENIAMIDAYKALSPENSAGISQFITKYFHQAAAIPSNYDIATQIVAFNLNQATLGASGAVFGCATAFAYLFPNTVFLIYYIIPLKAKWAIPGYIVFELFSAVRNSAGDNIAHVAHLGGALVGFLLVYFWNKNNRKTFY
jgi:membrane associated rhomboid family serine protease